MRSPTGAAAVAHVARRSERDELAALDLQEPHTGRRVLAADVHRAVHATTGPGVHAEEALGQAGPVQLAAQLGGVLDEQLGCRPGELAEEGRLGAGSDLLQPAL